MKSRILFFIIAFCLCQGCLVGQKRYKAIPNNLIPSKFNESGILLLKKNSMNHAYHLENLLPRSYVKDGSLDYTVYIQNALNTYRNIIFPNFPLLVNGDGLTVRSNSNLIFQKDSKLILKANSKGSYEVLRIHNVSNVNIFDPKIVGDKHKHIGNNGEWGMGIAIRVSNNIRIYNPIVSECWGDGIYVGSMLGNINGKKKMLKPSSDITIYNAIIDDNRRNAISVVSVNGLKIYNSVLANTQGTFPKAGLDIEPMASDVVNNIEINNLITYNNAGSGLVIALAKFAKSTDKEVNIKIKNHHDYFSSFGLRIPQYRGEAKGKMLPPIKGRISVSDCKWQNNPYGSLVIEDNQRRAPSMRFVNNLLDPKGNGKLIKGKAIQNSAKVKKSLKSNASIKFQ